MLPVDHRRRRQVHEISSDDLATATEVAARLLTFDLEDYTDSSLRTWLFKAREELAKRGELHRIRDHLPYWITDLDSYQAKFHPRAALPSPPASMAATHAVKAIPGQIVG
jgi:hypothetical protein